MRTNSYYFGLWTLLLLAACGSEKDGKVTPRVTPPFVPVTGNAQDKTIENDIYVGNSLAAIEISLPGAYDDKCAGANSVRWSLAEDVGTVTLADQTACRVTFTTSDKFQGGGKLIADLSLPDEGMIHFIMNLKMRNVNDIRVDTTKLVAIGPNDWDTHRDSTTEQLGAAAWFSGTKGTVQSPSYVYLDLTSWKTGANATCGANRSFFHFSLSPVSQRKFSVDFSSQLVISDANREDDQLTFSLSCQDAKVNSGAAGLFRADFCPLKFQPITLASRSLNFEFKGRYFNRNDNADKNLLACRSSATATTNDIFTTYRPTYFYLMDDDDSNYVASSSTTATQAELKIYLHVKHAHYNGELVAPILLGTILVK